MWRSKKLPKKFYVYLENIEIRQQAWRKQNGLIQRRTHYDVNNIHYTGRNLNITPVYMFM